MSDENTPNRRIDEIRDSALSFKVGDESEGEIRAIIPIQNNLYVVKDRVIYSVILADDIDPNRTREDIPNAMQKVVEAGALDDVVIRTFLTGYGLFRKERVAVGVDYEAALLVVFDIMEDLLSAKSIISDIEDVILKNREKKIYPEGGVVVLPSLPNIGARTKSVIQKIDHALINIYKLACVFYGEETLRGAGPWLDGLSKYLSGTLAGDEKFVEVAKNIAVFGKAARNVRHCIEHPKSGQRIVLTDYQISPNKNLVEPSIEVIHKDTPFEKACISDFMNYLLDSTLTGAELLMAFLAAYHMAPLGGFEIGVGEIPVDQRRDGVRYGYLINLGGKLHRLG
ncbi:hypothetical protein CXZ10_11300 [Pleomorphomonas diazotrophica]|uniref:Uncharacterized protein n=1 Tax=Pleomorphomonas diazotrophica TaxID=1166257 RepID=A0A1I4WIH8_9HYPH|nr:hypothetical protein [Pleomorphomonas diazotrophica]PKR89095.1 hypothetical protein CXZ10_11300 [Pleomorphomonas diazotrophica]SFN13247.1 hypothetical protein SAMN05192571_11743 [Pleomorphomonas diazotrophica]